MAHLFQRRICSLAAVTVLAFTMSAGVHAGEFSATAALADRERVVHPAHAQSATLTNEVASGNANESGSQPGGENFAAVTGVLAGIIYIAASAVVAPVSLLVVIAKAGGSATSGEPAGR